MQNLQTLCQASGCWLSFDIETGKWAVTINGPGTSQATFNDSNIIGGINISGTGINELYNAVEVEFPHIDLADSRDYVRLEIPTAQRFANEPDNTLTLSFDCINDPMQAELIGARELKQSRVDKVIEFRTDFSKIGLKAGDLITVTNTMYGFSNKMFRIIKIVEDDANDGVLTLTITALEYDADVYSTAGLTRTERNRSTGLINPTVLKEADVINNVNNGFPWRAYTFFANTIILPANSYKDYSGAAPNYNVVNLSVIDTGFSYTAPISGSYMIDYFINWGGNRINPSPFQGILKVSGIRIYINGVNTQLGFWAQTGDAYVQLYEDHTVKGYFSANKGDVISFRFEYAHDWSTANYVTPPGYPVYTALENDVAAIWIVGVLTLMEARQ